MPSAILSFFRRINQLAQVQLMPVQDRFPRFMEDQREFFDQLITEDWHDYASPDWDFVRKHEIRKLFERIQPERILDVGCGCGFHDREMAEYEFVTSVDAIDYSAASVARANESYGHSKVKRWVADINEMSAEMQYDLVVSFQVFEHLSRPDRFLDRCSALCKDNGYVAIFTPNRRRLSNIRRWLGLQKSIMLDPQHFREYTAGEIAKLGRRHGLTLADRFGYGMHGIRFVDRMPVQKTTRLGEVIPFAAHGICVVMQKGA